MALVEGVAMMPEFEKRVLADGRAIMYRGDCLELLRAGVFCKIGAIVSDPPYGIDYEKAGGGGHRLVELVETQRNSRQIHGDNAPFDPAPWVEAAPQNAHMQTGEPERRILLWGAEHYMQRLPTGGTMLAWDKHCGRGPDDSFADCEWAWCGRTRIKREIFRWLWKGIVCQKTPLDHSPTKGGDGKRFSRVHISQKPVELMRWCIDKVRPLADLPILDPYMGSGSTGVAAISLGHAFVGCEIDPDHFEVACARIEMAWAIGDYSAGPLL